MRFLLGKNYEQMSRKAANLISAQVILKPDSVIGLATGSTPLGLYETLISWYMKGDISFSKCRTVNLDEYVGLDPKNEQSYAYFMNKNLFKFIDIKPENTHLPNGLNLDNDAECKRYDELIKSLGGVDIQLLGIGNNGHIGFNEPSDEFKAGTNCVKLTESTIKANSRFFESIDDVPKFAYTMGIRSIIQAKYIVLVASGKNKAKILEEALFGPVTPQNPASILQMVENLAVCGDEEAFSVIKEKHKDIIFE